MSTDPNKLSKFWQELKRRNVVRVITVYAGVAFVILELLDMIREPFELPNWSFKLVVVILSVGLIIAVILSWIYDIHPNGVVVKTEPADKIKPDDVPKSYKGWKIASYISFVLIVVLIILNVFPRNVKRDINSLRSQGRIALAVLPFQNMTHDTTWNIWQSGIQNILISDLSNFSRELIVRQMESVEYIVSSEGMNFNATITPNNGVRISRKLNTDIFIRGNIIKDNSAIRINTQLVDSQSGDVFKSFRVEASNNNIISFEFIDVLSKQVKDYLLLSQRQQELPDEQLHLATTKNPEAYSYYAKGKYAFSNRDWPVAEEYFNLAIQIDPDFTFAYILLSWVYRNSGNIDKALETHQKVYLKKDSLPTYLRNKLMYQHAGYYLGPEIQIKYLKMLLESDDLDPFNHYDLGKAYAEMNNYDEAIIQYRKALEIYKRWRTKPFWIYNYLFLGYVYHETGQFGKEKRIYRKTARDFPGDGSLLRSQSILYYTLGKIEKGDKYMAEYEHLLMDRSLTDADIISVKASIYLNSKQYVSAEEYYRKVIEEYGQTSERLNDLALFLIDTDQNIEEGLALVEIALKADQENPHYLATKGWGIYKLGNGKEALQILNTANNLNPIYDRRINGYIRRIKETP